MTTTSSFLSKPSRASEGISPMLSPVYLRRDKAAQHVRDIWGLPCSPRWLAKLAVVGGGPVFRRAGRIPIYAPADLDEWALSRIGAPQKSTSDRP
jgi:hypothetical protein